MQQKLLIKNIKSIYSIPQLEQGKSILINEEGNIEAYGDIDILPDYRILDASGLSLSPGWIDIHTHVYNGVTDIAINPDLIGPETGVTALVDAGSAGHITYPGFRNLIVNTYNYDIFSFLNLGSAGIIRANIIGDYETDEFIQTEETIRCAIENRDNIKGIKLRACSVVLKGRGIEIVKQASLVAREAALPLMVHIGEPDPQLKDILNELNEGDIVTHCYHGKPGGILNNPEGKIIKEAYMARDRGVLFDVGHGGASFNCNIGREAIIQGFKPDLIGTDLHGHNIDGPVYSLPITMSKLLSCGLDVKEIIQMVTIKPAQVLDLVDYQKDIIGSQARFTLFTIKEGKYIYHDSNSNPITCNQSFNPQFTVIGDRLTPCLPRGAESLNID